VREQETPHVRPDNIASDGPAFDGEYEGRARESEGVAVHEEEYDKQDDVQEEDDGGYGDETIELVRKVMNED
jgi:hypothetical protein